MSIAHMNAVLDLPPDATSNAAERLVLVVIADHANMDGMCWPSVSRVARRAGLSSSHVRRCIANLCDAGLLDKVERDRHADGSLGVWRYRIAVEVADT